MNSIVVHAQLPGGAPTCAQDCIAIKLQEAGALAPGVDAQDIAQLCTTPTFVTAYSNCVADNCPTGDVPGASSAFTTFCSNAQASATTTATASDNSSVASSSDTEISSSPTSSSATSSVDTSASVSSIQSSLSERLSSATSRLASSQSSLASSLRSQASSRVSQATATPTQTGAATNGAYFQMQTVGLTAGAIVFLLVSTA
ncbi:hypothetical protein OIO90_005522 [Microbotryomycetes sp. JL221]|nr:hypothetical protein OIO90_005522 [Microbotryomycetes sp. JL221]